MIALFCTLFLSEEFGSGNSTKRFIIQMIQQFLNLSTERFLIFSYFSNVRLVTLVSALLQIFSSRFKTSCSNKQCSFMFKTKTVSWYYSRIKAQRHSCQACI